MRKKTKLWLAVAATLVVLGGVIFVGAFAAAGFHFASLSTSKLITTTHEITDSYQNISILTDTADVWLVPSDDTTTRVECADRENLSHTVKVVDGTLVIEISDTRAWYEHIGIFFSSTGVKVFLPKSVYGTLTIRADTSDVEISKDISLQSIDVKVSTGDVALSGLVTDTISIETTTGDIDMSHVTCTGPIALRVTTGDVELEGVTCQALTTTGDTGELSMERVLVAGILSIERSTGDVDLEACDAAEITIITDTGDVEGTLLTGKTFVVETDIGRKRIPQGSTGGRCEIITDTGDVEIEIRS